jgi:hypothetical protein
MTEILDVTFTLTDAELDAVSGGQASVSVTLSGSASGPTSADVTASATGTTATVGGLAPSQSASLAASFTVSSS